MGDPTSQNRLEEERSPYLRAHADNPVNWQPWDERALDAAARREVPIFLSIGYSACHWCHVMAEESFEDEGIAALLNDHFVPIKVDREERPDIDSIYMTVCQLVNQRGCGWPLSVWLTPEGLPFYVGTYFPKEPARGQPGFRDLLEDIAGQWADDRSKLRNRGRQWMQAASSHHASPSERSEGPPGSDLLESAAAMLVRQADREYGGFGSGQKFPQPSRLELLAEATARTAVPETGAVLEETLDAMADGGLRDQLGGGFHRYCVDREWTVPHFEKMLYDNATISRVYLLGFQLTGRSRYAAIAEETFDFVRRELTHPDGAFYSTLDARSHPETTESEPSGRGEEGAFYVWTPEQVEQAMQKPVEPGSTADPTLLSDLLTARYGITETGNFEGATVLTISRSVDELAAGFERNPEDIRDHLSTAEERLRRARDRRPRPPRDEKVLAGWNGLMIDTLATGSLVTGEERYLSWAREALAFLEDVLWDGETLYRRYKADRTGTETDSPVKGPGMLEDYAFLARGALQVYQVAGDMNSLRFALELGRAIEREFWEPESGSLYFAPETGTDIPVRPQEIADQSTPSSTGVAVEVLLALDTFAPNAGFGAIGQSVLETHGEAIEDAPGRHATLLRAAERARNGNLEVTIAAAQQPPEWLDVLGGRYLPDLLLAPRPPDGAGLSEWISELGLQETPPVWAGREAKGEATAYVCRNACSPPVSTVEDIETWVEEFAI